MQQPAPRRDIATLPLPPSLRQKLTNKGVHTAADLNDITASDLTHDGAMSSEEATEVLRVRHAAASRATSLAGALSAQDIFEKEARSRKIVSFCQELDTALGGGVATGQVAEFCGVPAVGKTQLGMQLAVDVQLPRCFGGLGGQALYIDTEGSFMVERVVDIAAAFTEHLQKIAKRSSSAEKQAAAKVLTLERLLAGIRVMRATDFAELLATVHMLPELLAAAPEVKLVVIDSVTFHFRHDFTDMGRRTRLLGDMGQRLMQLAAVRDVAVVLTNQITTTMAEEGGSSKLIPALGDAWAHQATTRVILYWEGGQRRAHLYKSPSLPATTVDFFITDDGIRGRKREKRPRE